MIGYFIKGTDVLGNDCFGEIMDKVTTMQSVELQAAPLQRGQVIPMPLDAYLVHNIEKDTLHLVPPHCITKLIADFKELQALKVSQELPDYIRP